MKLVVVIVVVERINACHMTQILGLDSGCGCRARPFNKVCYLKLVDCNGTTQFQISEAVGRG